MLQDQLFNPYNTDEYVVKTTWSMEYNQQDVESVFELGLFYSKAHSLSTAFFESIHKISRSVWG